MLQPLRVREGHGMHNKIIVTITHRTSEKSDLGKKEQMTSLSVHDVKQHGERK
jgi:hypothetical protein